MAGALLDLFPWLIGGIRNLGLPLGGIAIGVGLGAILYVTLAWLRGRLPAEGSGTVRVHLRPDGSPGAGGMDGARPVRLFDRDGVRTLWMEGAGEHPSTPLPRARRFVVLLVLAFVAGALLLLLGYTRVFASYDHLVALIGSIVYWPLSWPGVYAVGRGGLVVPDYIFPMYLAAMVAFALASGLLTNHPRLPRDRRWKALAVVLVYVGVELVLDALFFTIPGATLRNLALIIRSFTGGLFLALLTFCAVYFPPPQRLVARGPRDRAALGWFFGIASASIASATVLLLFLGESLHLKGTILPVTILLLLPILALMIFGLLARPLYFHHLRARGSRSLEEFHPPVTILIPAYNEEEWIEEAILSADRAAARYPGPVEIVVANDGSTDRTLEFARGALPKLRHAQGIVVDLPHGGKSNALNGGLAVATGEIVIRCDGDSFLSEDPGFAALIPHLADPEVGGVQGSIHPRQREGWTRKLRGLEVAWNHYFLRPAGMGTLSAEVIDGLFSAFRRADLVAIGGWVPWNGEDSEISIRLQRLGYRIRIEFGALALEDVPSSYDALRRQRVRWARGILMANGQHYPALIGPTPEFGGLGVLFWFLMQIRSGVRSLIFLYLALLIVILGVPALLDTGVLFAIAIAVRAGPLAYFLVRMRRRDLLPWILFFPFFNALKQTFRFEAYGTLGPTAAREYV